MNICVVAEVALNHYGWRRWREIVEGLALNNNVHLVSFCNDKYGKPLSKNVKKHLVDKERVGGPEDTKENVRKFSEKLMEVIKKNNFDFLYLCNPNRLSGKAVIRAKEKTNIVCVLDYGDFASAAELELGVINKKEYKSRLNLENKIIRTCDYFSVTNESLRERIKKQGKNGDIFVKIPNGVNISEFSHLKPDKILKKYKLNNGKKKVIFSGTLNKSKGIDTFIKCIPLVDYNNFEAVITGERNLSKWKSMVRDENLDQNVDINFLGLIEREDVSDLFSASSVGTAPFKKSEFSSYSCPLKITEYFGAGLPVVASRLSGIEELIEDGLTGLLVEPGNEEHLADAITKILKNNNLAEKISKNEKKTALNYSWDNLVSNLESFLKSKI